MAIIRLLLGLALALVLAGCSMNKIMVRQLRADDGWRHRRHES